jgi:hypothetical protein
MDFSLSIGIDKYIHLNETPFAENDAKGFSEIMEKVFNIDNPVLVVGNNATFTNIEFNFKKIVSKLDKDDRFFLFFAGHGMNFKGTPHISACDSANSVKEAKSWHNVNRMLEIVNKTGCQKNIFFIDACESTIQLGSRTKDFTKFSIDEIKKMISKTTYSCVFSACSHKGVADVMLDEKHGIWTYFLLKALGGKEPKALNKNLLTNFTLKKYLNYYVKEHCKKDPRTFSIQQSFTWGKEESEFLIWEFPETQIEEYKDIPKSSIERVQFVSITMKGVKRLSGFKQGSHVIPKYHTSAVDSFISNISKEEIEEHMDEVATSLRKLLKLKKDDFSFTMEKGSAEFKCPYFTYYYDVKIDEDDLSQAKFIATLVPHHVNKLIEVSEDLDSCFPDWFDFLLYTLRGNIDVPELIGKIDEIGEVPGYDYKYNNKCSVLELRNKTLNRTIIIKEDEIEIHFKAMEKIPAMLDSLKELANQMLSFSPDYKLLD